MELSMLNNNCHVAHCSLLTAHCSEHNSQYIPISLYSILASPSLISTNSAHSVDVRWFASRTSYNGNISIDGKLLPVFVSFRLLMAILSSADFCYKLIYYECIIIAIIYR